MAIKVLLVGSSSGVGLQVTKALLEEGDKFEVYALVRDEERAKQAIGEEASKVKFLHGDVTKKETLVEPSAGKDAIVCTVGAQAGWRLPGTNHYTPRYVDYLGVKNLSEAAAAAKVPRFVLVSSMGITRPLWPVSILLNTMFGRVLYWKGKGEEALRAAYRSQDLAYFIARPGGLNNKAGGRKRIVLEQGDDGYGTIPRSDVARVVVACAQGLCRSNVTFEIYSHKEDAPQDDLSFEQLVADTT
eukprot:TRINITY_DN16545_c0_g1_i1.p1 TRINITY_DN16545_c0_g1~~TRINITY_DN16545_c0_g1_i1.p1  ORF type:complete len:244 (-),score=45.21 TRINITY_DN16545_c0_g1_i1:102-833(-)